MSDATEPPPPSYDEAASEATMATLAPTLPSAPTLPFYEDLPNVGGEDLQMDDAGDLPAPVAPGKFCFFLATRALFFDTFSMSCFILLSSEAPAFRNGSVPRTRASVMDDLDRPVSMHASIHLCIHPCMLPCIHAIMASGMLGRRSRDSDPRRGREADARSALRRRIFSP